MSQVTRRTSTGSARISAAKAAMSAQGFDALLLTTGTNLLFLSGYPFVEITLARPFFLVVPARGEPVLLVHMGREVEARTSSWIGDVRIYRQLSIAPTVELARIFDDLDLRRGRVGLELGFEQRLGIPVNELERIKGELAPTRFDDAADLLWRLRMVKSAWDVESIRAACRITGEAYERTFAESRNGEIDRAIAQRMRSEMADLGGTDPSVVIASGPGNYEMATGVPLDRRVEAGDMVWMDCQCSVDGFWSDFSRAGVIGGPTAEQEEAQRLIIDATEAGVSLVGPGVPVADVAAASNEQLHALGLPVIAYTSDLAGRIGHGVGYDPTEPPHVSEQDPTILEPGMVISVEPGVATDFGLFHVEQIVLVTADGHEVLSTIPSELRTIREG